MAPLDTVARYCEEDRRGLCPCGPKAPDRSAACRRISGSRSARFPEASREAPGRAASGYARCGLSRSSPRSAAPGRWGKSIAFRHGEREVARIRCGIEGKPLKWSMRMPCRCHVVTTLLPIVLRLPRLYGKQGIKQATRLGLEPRMREPKSLVLPLHYRVVTPEFTEAFGRAPRVYQAFAEARPDARPLRAAGDIERGGRDDRGPAKRSDGRNRRPGRASCRDGPSRGGTDGCPAP